MSSETQNCISFNLFGCVYKIFLMVFFPLKSIASRHYLASLSCVYSGPLNCLFYCTQMIKFISIKYMPQ